MMEGPLDGDGGADAEVDPEGGDEKARKDELASKREEREKGSASVEERAAAGEGEEEEPDGQFALGRIEGDEGIKWSTLIPRGIPVKHEVSVLKAAVPGEGLLDPKQGQQLVSDTIVAKVELVYNRFPIDHPRQREIESVTIRQHVRNVYTVKVNSEAGKVALEGR